MRCCGGRAVAFFIDAPPSDPLLHQRCGDGAGDNLFLLRTAARRRGQQAASSDRLQTKYSPVRHVLTQVGELAGKGNMPALGWSEATPCEFQGLDVRASQNWGGNSLAGNQCQRWLGLFPVFG